jgi:carboxyl-terminal processing protease
MKGMIPKVAFESGRRFLLSVFLVAAIFGIGYYFGIKGFVAKVESPVAVRITRIPPPDKEDLDFSLFWKVWDVLHSKYYDKSKVVDSELVYGAIRGMTAAIGDPYTVFLSPRENKMVEEDLKGSFEGVGIQIGFKKDQLAVIAPLPGSPAEKAGILAGDYILEIKDDSKGLNISTNGISITEAVEAIRGKSGTVVTLVLAREGREKPIEVKLVRESIDVPSVTLSYPGEKKDIAYVKLVKFTQETVSEWENAVSQLVINPDLKAVIIDLRNNPGGYLQAAVDISSDFLETGDLVVKEVFGNYLDQEYKVTKLGRLRKVELALLVNQGSASASEIFAGAMRDYKRAIIIGNRTFGKGTVQEPEQLDKGSGLHITVAKWLTPKGIWVDGDGLQPDIEIDENPDTKEDEQLQKALEELTQKLK